MKETASPSSNPTAPTDAAYRSRLAYILLYPVTVSSAYRSLTSSSRTDSTSGCSSV